MKNTILIADDMDINREILEAFLCDDYRIILAKDGADAMRKIEAHRDELVAILLDIMMPNLDGIEVLTILKKKDYLTSIPVIIISSDETMASEKECFKLGASDFIHKPFDREMIKTRVNNVVELYIYKQHLVDTVNEQTAVIKKRNTDMLEFLGNLVETRDLESGRHVQRVKSYTRIIAQRLMKKYPKYGLDQKKVDIIVSASSLHDIGKIAIPDNILLKPGRLTSEEFEVMKKHTTKGGELLDSMRTMWDDEYGRVSYNICRYHHERWDGKGYPEGLCGNKIPIAAQIVSIADVYDALTTMRCYKEAYNKTKAFNMILDGECGAINPDVIDCFIDTISEMEEVV